MENSSKAIFTSVSGLDRLSVDSDDLKQQENIFSLLYEYIRKLITYDHYHQLLYVSLIS